MKSKKRGMPDAMLDAVLGGDTKKIGNLAKKGVDLNAKDERGRTAFSYAASQGNIPVLRTLLELGADPNIRTTDTNEDGNGDEEGFTALMDVAKIPGRVGDFESGIMQLLDVFRQSANDAGDKSGETDSAQNGTATPAVDPETRELFRFLVEAGIDVNARDAYGKTALIHAAGGLGTSGNVQILLELGADPSLRDSQGTSAMMMAYFGINDKYLCAEKEQIIALLRAAGAPESGTENVLLVHAASEGALEKVRELIRSGADLTSHHGASALPAAAREGHIEVVRELVSAGTEVNAFYGGSALEMAAREGHVDVVRELIGAGANVNFCKNAGDFTPLIHAAYSGHLETARLLVEAGADVKMKVTDMGSALDYAKMGGHEEVVAFLKGRKAKEKDLRSARGIASTYVNETALVVRSSVEATAEAFARIRGAVEWEKDVFGKQLRSTDLCFVVYQFKGHAWTLIQYVHNDWKDDMLRDDDAAQLSQDLSTAAMFYENSDTADYLTYKFFEKGEELESFVSGYDLEGPSDDEDEDDEPSVKIVSKLRKVSPKKIKDPAKFADQFVKTLEAFIPGWSETARCAQSPGEEFKFSSLWLKNSLVRMDFVSVR